MKRTSDTSPLFDRGLAPAGAERILALLVALFVLIVGFETGAAGRKEPPATVMSAVAAAFDDAGPGDVAALPALRVHEGGVEGSRQPMGADPVAAGAGLVSASSIAVPPGPSGRSDYPFVAQGETTAHRPRGPPVG